MPETSQNILSQLNIENKDIEYREDLNYKTGTPSPLFQRIDKEAKLKEIEESKK